MIKFLFIALLVFSMIGYVSKRSDNKPIEHIEPIVTTDGSVDISDTDIEQDIVFFEEYKNWAAGYQCRVTAVDRYGNEYDYDFSDEPEDMPDLEKLDKMKELVSKNDSKNNLYSQDEMKYLYELLQKVDKNAGFDEEGAMCDYGQRSLYGVRYDDNGSCDLVLLESYGDWMSQPKDKNAKMIYEYFNK